MSRYTLIPRHVADYFEALVRPNKALSKCVVFVGVESNGRFVPVGTGMIIQHGFHDHHVKFIATATHVLDSISTQSVWVRLNRHDGGSSTIELPKAHLLVHANPANDIALMPIDLDYAVHDFGAMSITKDGLYRDHEYWSPRPGDEVCAIGLYTSHFGQSKNITVVRVGNIASIPDEKVIGPGGSYIDAYLVELKTIAGLSGSPVFVTVGPVQFRNGQTAVQSSEDASFIPLGILLGYHLVETAEDQISVPQYADAVTASAGGHVSMDQRNTGFGIVAPFERVLEILERDDVVQGLEQSYQAFLAKSPFQKA